MSFEFSDNIVKPAIAGATAFAIDKFYFKEYDMQKSIMFAGSVGGGVFLGALAADALPLETTFAMLGNGKAIEARVLEIGCGAGVAYAVNKFILKNDLNKNDLMKRVGTIVVCDIVGEFGSDIIAGRPLNFLA
jgi:hypothetical protein